MADVIHVYVDDAGSWRWKKVALNEERVAASGEAFDSRFNAIRSAEREREGTDAELVIEEPELPPAA